MALDRERQACNHQSPVAIAGGGGLGEERDGETSSAPEDRARRPGVLLCPTACGVRRPARAIPTSVAAIF
ncbi:MAG TPA: hypothetical protein VLL97_01865 [Acidobacteriota bacterium]|nr:hypothetical protein [Acidobacteriota bacterium]